MSILRTKLKACDKLVGSMKCLFHFFQIITIKQFLNLAYGDILYDNVASETLTNHLENV